MSWFADLITQELAALAGDWVRKKFKRKPKFVDVQTISGKRARRRKKSSK